MNQVMVTIVAPLDPARLSEAEQAIDSMGNPALPKLAQGLNTLQGGLGIHFVSLHAIPSFTPGRAHLLLEFSADGNANRAIAQLIDAIGGSLTTVFGLACDWASDNLATYLTRHVIKTGFGLAAAPGIGHVGTPGFTVGRIRAEAELASKIEGILASQSGGMTALARLDAVRAALGSASPDLSPGDAPPAYSLTTILGAIRPSIVSFVKTFLWPWLLVIAAIWLALLLTLAPRYPLEAPGWAIILGCTIRALKLAGILLVLFLLGLAVFAALAYARLRWKEAHDWISSRAPDRETLHAIIARENAAGYAHNHMISLAQFKSGWLRSFAMRLVFWLIATAGPLLYKPGYLGSIGTIHFARWITIPGTRDFVFLSNYGGSWESYLEDFITLAHNGLTGVWSNTVGFPKTVNLIGEGATDGERFKRHARQSMLPTRFWFSAYPGLNTDMIRTNAAIRLGLSSAMTEDDAAAWLSRFGSALRPPNKLVSSDIQSLLFGGLGFLPFACCTFWRLPREREAARRWLGEIKADIAWNDGRRLRDNGKMDAIYQLALSAEGLAALGLPEVGLNSFPPAFLDGMDTASRARILGDVDANDSGNWWWKERADVAVLVYGEDALVLAAQRRELADCGITHGANLLHEVELLPTQEKGDAEPFGFADGLSQPVIRGTYKGQRNNTHSMHVVEPGEFILGYPDNRGNMPPGPILPAIHDPANVLPVRKARDDFATNDVNRARDLGFNGSFLVIRQLEQDVEGFSAYCERETQRLKTRLDVPYEVTPDFIGAKMVGRWRNGVPLVRAPYNAPDGEKNPEALRENNFQLGFEDPEGLRCPFGAHIRRANPRDSLSPGSEEQIGITNRHRMMRVGRKYAPKEGQNPGLLFMCLNGDLERQFEFVQQTWINGNVISLTCPMNLSGERDPLLNNGETNNGFTIPSRDGPVKLSPMQRFVTTRGGGYFFLPSRQLVEFLSA